MSYREISTKEAGDDGIRKIVLKKQVVGAEG